MCHTVFMTTVETRDFSCQRKCSKTKAACRDKNAARVRNKNISSAPSNNLPLCEFREDWGLQQFIILELQDPYRSWAQIRWDKSLILLRPHWRWSCPVDRYHRWHFVLLIFIWGRKGKEEVSWPRKGPQECALGIQQPPSADCCSVAAPVWGNGSNSWPCLTLLMHWCMEVTDSVVHIAATKFLRAGGKLES